MNLPLGAQLWIADAPEHPKGMILICPGGGYQWLSPREAQPVARAFAAAGWAAAVVYYTVRETPAQPPLGTLPVRQLGEALQTCSGVSRHCRRWSVASPQAAIWQPVWACIGVSWACPAPTA